MPFYALRWESKDEKLVEVMATQKAEKNNLFEELKNTNKFSDLLSRDKIKKIANFSKDLYREGIDTFKQARANAKTTGKMLAHFLIASRNEIFGE